MFGSTTIGTEHLAFALDEGGDATATALAQSLDREAIKQRLGVTRGAPSTEMVFGVSAKRAIEYAFENARRLGHNFIGTPHLALGMLATDDPPPLVGGVDLTMLRARLDAVAQSTPVPRTTWALRAGEPLPFVEHLAALLSAYRRSDQLGPPGTRIALTVTPPGGPERRWVLEREDAP
jgi:ATP-dependent Clp protease ATP-binding subunit ClpC